MQRRAAIITALRTPVGRHAGALASVRPDDLAAHVIKAVVARSGIDPALIEDVYFGATNQAGEDNRNVARMAALLAGLPVSVPGSTVNRLCASGLEAVNIAARMIEADHGGQQVRHPFSGVALAYKHGIPGEVMHIIATHSHEGDKVERSIESIIFHHADFVDFDIAKVLGKRAAKKERVQSSIVGRTSTTPQSIARSSAARFVGSIIEGSRKLRNTATAPGAAARFTAAKSR